MGRTVPSFRIAAEAAMGNSTLPTVLDKLCMVANINTRKLIEVIKAEIKLKEIKIQELAKIIDSLQQKRMNKYEDMFECFSCGGKPLNSQEALDKHKQEVHSSSA
jgi:hypothetical protein